ncbi:hypothetical protein [Fluviispira multicolorata]|uniref:MFS transporter n=1 Tax=Fluviispira multicolorata TaxID=2654512 RepID=A0A833JDL5_9BACT|nr:hypothetical protein [Fluviispira multicolorata]KAB8031935.1 hypothetical protein GCL57_04625 [Fluviispira multicolorata]
MIKYNYSPIFLLMLAEALERFAYFFVSFIFIIYMMTPLSSGGLGISQEISYKTAGIFSISLLILPLILSPIVDRKIGMQRATSYGGALLFFGYIFAFLSFYINTNIIYFSFALCALGSSLVKPSMSALVSRVIPNNFFLLDILYIIFIVVVNISSISSAYIASFFVMKFSTSLYNNFLFSAFLLLVYFIVIGVFHKKISLQTEEKKLVQKSKFLYFSCFLLCFLIGISVTLSSKIFPAPSSALFWSIVFIGIFLFTFFLYKIRKNKNKYVYSYLIILFLIFFFIANLFVRKFGIVSPIIPSLYYSFDMLFNFVAFPVALSIIARVSHKKYLVTSQAFLLFLFAYGSILMKNNLSHALFIEDSKFVFLAVIILSTVTLLFILCSQFLSKLNK